MIRFLVSTFLTAFGLPFFLRWSATQTSTQITKMQEGAFDTPGAASPIPPSVLVSALGLLGGHVTVWTFLLGMKKRDTALSLTLGSILGIVLFLYGSSADQEPEAVS